MSAPPFAIMAVFGGLWLGVAAWALYAPQSLAWAFAIVGGGCCGLGLALGAQGIIGARGRHRGAAPAPPPVLGGHVLPGASQWEYGIPPPPPAPAGPPWGPAEATGGLRLPPRAGSCPTYLRYYPDPHEDEDDECPCPHHPGPHADDDECPCPHHSAIRLGRGVLL
jgi:hypothetical protein